MPQVDPVILQLRADVAEYKNQLKSTTVLVDASLAKQEAAVRRLEATMERSFGGMGALVGRFTGLLAGIGGIGVAREFLRIADTAKQIDSQLKLATNTFGSFTQAQADSQRIAGETRSSLEATTALYGGFIRAAEQGGKSQADAARATETFSKALKIGGADANAAASATLQFSQALASGALRGDEFNSIAEASPRILRLLADALGVPQGALRKMAEEGKLTSDVLYRALTDRRFTDGIDSEFKQLPVTFGEAMTAVQNAAILTFGAFDRGGEFSTALANFITDGADGFKDMASSAAQTGIDIRATFAGLHDVFSPLVAGAYDAFGSIDQRANYTRDTIANILRLYDNANNALVGVGNFGTRFDNALKRGANRAIDRAGGGQHFQLRPLQAESDQAGAFLRGFDRSQRRSRAKERLRQAVTRLENNGFVVPTSEVNGELVVDRSGIKRKTVTPPSRPAAATDKPKKSKGPSAETLAKRAEAARLAQLRDDEAFASEQAALNRNLLSARRAMVTAAETIAEYDRQEVIADRDRQNAGYQADVAQKRTTQARADMLIALNNQVAAERIKAIDLREEERRRKEAVEIADGDLTNQRDLLTKQQALATTTAERRDIGLRLVDLAYQLERAQLEDVLASKEASQTQKEIARRRLALLDGMQAADREAVNRDTETPGQRYSRELNESGQDINGALEQIQIDGLNQLNDGLTDAIMGTKSLGDAFKDMANSIIRDLIRIAVQQAIVKPIANALFGGTGGTGGDGGAGALASLFGRASGGYVAPGQTVRVNESRGGMELLRMGSQGGTVIPLGSSKAAASAGTTIVLAPQTILKSPVMVPELLTEIDRRNAEGIKLAAPYISQAGADQAMKQMGQQQRLGTYQKLT